ncbi:queuosine precursor transporter [Patescibacteria group bacterium]|nr:queuosine precursor transporter [Patescibacteria group bacterium]
MKDLKLQILYAVFIGLLVGVNLLGGKITTLFGISVSVGIFIAPLLFLITDIVEEVHGRKTVNFFIVGGSIALFLVLLYTLFFVNLPPNERYLYNEEYKIIFGSSIRMIIASIISFLISQTHDAFSFSYLKKKTNGKALWLRNNVSTIISQFIDTSIFMMIAFYNLTPKFTLSFIIELIIPYYLFKVLFAFLDTPFVYLGVKWLKNKKIKLNK